MVRGMSARLSDYDFDLPEELIAQRPLPRREDARMMVIDRAQETIDASAICRTAGVR